MLNDEIVKTIKQYKASYDEIVPKTSGLPFSKFYFMVRSLTLKRQPYIYERRGG
jgi:hypothetical protein